MKSHLPASVKLSSTKRNYPDLRKNELPLTRTHAQRANTVPAHKWAGLPLVQSRAFLRVLAGDVPLARVRLCGCLSSRVVGGLLVPPLSFVSLCRALLIYRHDAADHDKRGRVEEYRGNVLTVSRPFSEQSCSFSVGPLQLWRRRRQAHAQRAQTHAWKRKWFWLAVLFLVLRRDGSLHLASPWRQISI